MSAWIALVVAGVLTWSFKAGPSLLLGEVRLPDAIERANRFVSPALLGALTARWVLAQATGPTGPSALVVVVVAAPVAVRTRSVPVTVAVGLLVLGVLSIAVG